MNINSQTPNFIFQNEQDGKLAGASKSMTQTAPLSGQQLAKEIFANSIVSHPAAMNSLQISNGQSLLQFMKNLSQGDIFRAFVKDINKQNITLILSNGLEIQAKMGEALNLNINTEVDFLVKSNTEQGLILRPVESKQIPAELILKALQSTGLVQNEKNSGIVKTLIAHGQPINRESVMQTLKLVNHYPTESVDKLVEMQKHGLEIHEEALRQFDNYQKGEYKLGNQMQQISDALGSFIEQAGKTEPALVTDVLQKLAMAEQTFSDNKNPTPAVLTSMETTSIEAGKSDDEEAVSSYIKPKEQPLQDRPIGTNFTTAFEKGTDGIMAEQAVKEPLQHLFINELKQADSFGKLSDIFSALSEREELADIFRELSNSKELKHTIKEVFDKYSFLDLSSEDKEILENREIKELYDKMLKIADTLLEAVDGKTPEKQTLTQAAAELKGNLQFMLDVNQFAGYIQIPYKINERQEQSDLYVYGKKKRMVGKDEKITAFLHLDLENLGATDVHVELIGQSVSTKFVLSNRESERIVEEHLQELEERLKKQGYQVTLTTEMVETVSEGKSSVLDKILQEDTPTPFIKRYSFDIRA